jgi:GNAT superfamily N-acetyltransferase
LDIEIRIVVINDLPEILKLYRQPDMDDGAILPIQQAEAIFRKMSAYPDYKLYAAVSDGSIIGTYALAIMDNLAHIGAKSGLIEDVVVKSEFQGKGIGKQMMQHAMETCRRSGCYKISLSSNLKREKAHQF